MSGSNVSKQLSGTGEGVGVGSIIEVVITVDDKETNKTVVVTGASEDCTIDEVKDELDVSVVNGMVELNTIVVVSTGEIEDVVATVELCIIGELRAIDEVVGCTTVVVVEVTKMDVKVVADGISNVDVFVHTCT